MNIAMSWPLRATVFAVVLGAGPIQSTAAEQPATAVIAPAAAPASDAPALLAPAAAVTQQPVLAPLDAASLAPGEFVWQPERAATGPVEIVVSIPLQRAYVYRGRTLIGVTTVSTGRPGHATPTGRFPIMEKHREHYSNLYNNAPMPFMQRLTMGGIALHAGQIPGHPASHGCVRLPLAFARHLFSVTQVGANVHILDASPSAELALAAARGEQLRPVELAGAALAQGTR
jgi:lipoprotein-anchoring transpeptidase ErfK/SrfK